jgi:mRNA turnover protein 4
MPRSKRSTLYHLTKTQKKTKEDKSNLITRIQDALQQFDNLYVFRVDNMRNNFFKQLRSSSEETTYFYGKNKVMAKALGSSDTDEYLKNLHCVSEQLVGNVGLLFTKLEREQLQQVLDNAKQQDYARAGGVATFDFTLAKGPLKRYDDAVPHNMEPHLRQLGLPTQLNKGTVELRQDFAVCKKGDVLTPEQAQILVY